MIENRKQWEYTIQSVARMYAQRDQAKQPASDGTGEREDEIASVVIMIRKLEREIRDYAQSHPFTEDDYPELGITIATPVNSQNDAHNFSFGVGVVPAERDKVAV